MTALPGKGLCKKDADDKDRIILYYKRYNKNRGLNMADNLNEKIADGLEKVTGGKGNNPEGIPCPGCGNTIILSIETLLRAEKVSCPNCQYVLQFPPNKA